MGYPESILEAQLLKGKVLDGELFISPDYSGRNKPMLNKVKMGEGSGELSLPEGMSTDENTGHIYITDIYTSQIQVFNTDGIHLYKFSDTHCNEGKTNRPFCIYISNSIVYVSNCANHSISIFDTNGDFITQFGKKGVGLGELISPYGLAVNRKTGDLFVCEIESNQRVQIFSNEYPFYFQIQKRHSPRFVHLTNDHIYILYKSSPCIYKYNSKFEILERCIVTRGKNKQTKNPSSFCLDAFNNILLTDWATSTICIFNSNCKLITTISKDIDCPEAISIDNKGNIVVVSFRSNYCIQKF